MTNTTGQDYSNYSRWQRQWWPGLCGGRCWPPTPPSSSTKTTVRDSDRWPEVEEDRDHVEYLVEEGGAGLPLLRLHHRQREQLPCNYTTSWYLSFYKAKHEMVRTLEGSVMPLTESTLLGTKMVPGTYGTLKLRTVWIHDKKVKNTWTVGQKKAKESYRYKRCSDMHFKKLPVSSRTVPKVTCKPSVFCWQITEFYLQ